MAKNEVYNEWEGFDDKQKPYDDKKEKRYQAKIWWCLGGIGLGIFIGIIAVQIKEFNITRTYNSIEAEYYNHKNKAIYVDEEGVQHIYNIPSHSVKERDGKVLLYYKNNVKYADTVSTFTSWIPYYIFFGALAGLSGWRLWIIYKGRKHSLE